jgi:methionine sulfoxide reductase heme-binding subunit
MKAFPEKLLRSIKVVVFLFCLGPLGVLAWKAFHALLGANPVDVITRSTGKWTLVFLLLTLSVSPLRRLLRMPWLVRFRRMLGLYAFFYGTLHLMTYIWLDQFFNIQSMLHDIAKRKFITAGMTGFALMVPLAITSTSGWIRRMGGKRWQKLHRLIYLSATAGVVHFIWLVKADERRPIAYGSVLAALLLFRAATWLWNRSHTRRKIPVMAAAFSRQTANQPDGRV